MAKRIDNEMTRAIETDILRIVTTTPGLTVSAITKNITVGGFDILGKKEKRQMVQSTCDRLHRNNKLTTGKGAKKTGRAVTVYNAV